MKKIHLLSLVYLSTFFSLSLKAQHSKIQWASYVVDFSSEYSSLRNPFQRKAMQALGKPNKLPAYGLTACAWSASEKNSEDDEWLELGFEHPMAIRQVAIAENYNAGAISEIWAYDTKGIKHLLAKNETLIPLKQKGRMFRVILERKTTYKVNSIRIVLKTDAVNGWNQIDAIGISSYSKPIKAKINLAKGMAFAEIEKLSQTINSEYDEILPIISPDGKTLFFDRKNHPQNTPSIVSEVPNDDIWFSQFDGANWSVAQRLPKPLNNGSHNFVCSVSPDGQTVLLGNVYQKNGEIQGGVSTSQHISKNSWAFPKEVVIDNYYNKNTYSEFFLAANQKVLLLAIEREEGRGSRDIYVCFLQKNGTWTRPKNLGKNINTPEREITPFLAADGKTLYFASSGYSGFGSCDMFVSQRLDDTWQNWTEPLNLGKDLNSKDWDAAYTLDAAGEYAYFYSYKNSENDDIGTNADIFRAKLPKEIRPEPVVLIHGKVYNSETKKVIAATIHYELMASGKQVGKAQSDSLTGEYKIVLPLGANYGFWAGAEDFLALNEHIDLSKTENYQELKRDLYLTPIKIGKSIRLNNVFFEQSKADLLKESYSELDRIYQFLNQNPSLGIVLEGHTDIEGSPVQNMRLSFMRVHTIDKYLLSKKITKNRIQLKGFGSSQPITQKRDKKSKQTNRRVEFRIIKIGK
jgi:outer membrane protein OmpA-like peptidoglycan-associated protein